MRFDDRMRRVRAGLACAALVATAGTAAADPYAGGDVRWISGGVGDAEQAQMKQAAADHSLGLVFAARNGDYLADVDVVIRDTRGETVLETTSDGPILLVDLPPGRYRVQADFEGRTVQRAVQVPGRGHREVILHWPVTG